MAEPYTHPLAPVGAFMYLVAGVASGALGFLGKPAVPSIAVGAAVFTAGYIFVRLPQMVGLIRRDGPKALLAFVYLTIPYGVLSAIFYGIGWLFS